MVEASERGFDVLLRGKGGLRAEAKKAISQSGDTGRVRLLEEWRQVRAGDSHDLFVVWWRGDLLEEEELERERRAETRGRKRFLLLPDESPPESLPEQLCRLRIRSADRVHTPRLETDDPGSFLRRFLSGLARWPEGCAIADAWWEGDSLVVLSPTFRRLRVPVAALPTRLREAAVDERRAFEIDEEGEFLFWPAADVHMGWSQFEQAADPRARIRAEQRSRVFNERYGGAIRMLREEKGLTQTQVEGLAARTVRRIEHGQTRATAQALEKLAAAHGMEVGGYMGELARRLDDGEGA